MEELIKRLVYITNTGFIKNYKQIYKKKIRKTLLTDMKVYYTHSVLK